MDGNRVLVAASYNRSMLDIKLQSEKPVSNDGLLGTVCYSIGNDSTPPAFAIPLRCIGQQALWEVFVTPDSILRERWRGIEVAKTQEHLFATCELNESEFDSIADCVRFGYDQLIAFQAMHPQFNLVKVWNYIDNITHGPGDDERYRQFCVGRALACEPHWSVIPAGCALGLRTNDRKFRLFWLASVHPVAAIENPRQTSAYQYPRQYAPKAPLFSRATQCQGRYWVSGTASIVNSQSQHLGNLNLQLEEIFRNFESLFKGQGHDVLNDAQFKVYLKHPDHMEDVVQWCQSVGIHRDRLYFLESDVCREELLIEIEPVIGSALRSAGVAI